MKTIVVGAGIAGLVAATTLARAGAAVTLIEQADAPGGRARSQNFGGAWLNLGPHAIYDGGATRRILGELGIEIRGGKPDPKSFLMLRDERLVTVPMGPWQMMTSGELSVSEKWQYARFLAGLYTFDPREWDDRPLRELLDAKVSSPFVRKLAVMMSAIGTYAWSEALSAGTVLRQLRLALEMVTYPARGWQSIVDDLVATARGRGVEFCCGSRAVEARRGVVAIEERELRADAVILAVSPDVCEALTGHEFGPHEPTRMATLDIVLERTTRPPRNVIDPEHGVYLSFHSNVSDMGDGVVLHSAKYLDPLEPVDLASARADVEHVLDRAQPGWRGHMRHVRFLRRIPVNHWFCSAETGGQHGRPDVELAEGLFIAGDWVGREGMLADAAAASGKLAARRALQTTGSRRAIA